MLLLLLAYVVVCAASLGLQWLNLRYAEREGDRAPPELADVVDAERLRRIAGYTRERARFGIVSSLIRDVAAGAFLFSGLLGAYDRWIGSLRTTAETAGVLFFVGLSAAGALLGIPFSAYSSFTIEARHGFNRMSVGLFLGDWAKSTLLSLAFLAGMSAGALELVRRAPELWWLWAWGAFVVVSMLLTYLAPYLIEPLFFRTKPLEVAGLEAQVRALAQRAGVHVSRVLEVDASRRSSHSNAYFTGIGHVKRVVLFDTLLGQMSHAEILAVLAHELGHWKKRHVLSRMLLSYGVALAGLYLAARLAPASFVPGLVGLDAASLPARWLVLATLGSLVTFPLTPLASYWSRRHEWQADEFATELQGEPAALASALKKLASENLSNLHPHPLYAAYYYSHPPVAERIRRLLGRATHSRTPA